MIFNAFLTLDQIPHNSRVASYHNGKNAVCIVYDNAQYITASFHAEGKFKNGETDYVCNNASSYRDKEQAWDLFDVIRQDLKNEVQNN